jgi:hypothetical protein
MRLECPSRSLGGWIANALKALPCIAAALVPGTDAAPGDTGRASGAEPSVPRVASATRWTDGSGHAQAPAPGKL